MADPDLDSTRKDPNLGRFSALLVTLVGMLLLTALIDDVPGGFPRFRILFAAIFGAGVYAVSRNRRVLVLGIALAVPALALDWVSHYWSVGSIVIPNHVSAATFLGFIAAVILREILEETRVTLDTILGGICIYLLIGLIWVSLFTLLEYVDPGSFEIEGVSLTESNAGALEPERFPQLIYFSFVTLTTLGYGDVVPAQPPSRSLAVAEAVVGQLFVAIFIARLVGLHLVHSSRQKPFSD